MNRSFDVAIVGLGAMGSAAAYHLARRGLSVIGFDRFAPPHTLGSSHGETRIIREAYFEHPSYVPLVQRAYELWEQLEQYAGKQLLLQTGGLMIGSPDGELVTGAEFSARRHYLPHERLPSYEIQNRYPQFCVPDDMIAIRDLRAGILFPEACVDTHLHAARKHGAALHFDESVTDWKTDGTATTITTTEERYFASQLIISAGAWADSLLPDLNLPLSVERQVLFWFDAEGEANEFAPERFPIFVVEAGADDHFYGFPDIGTGVKVARMHHGEETNPNDIRRGIDEKDVEPVRAFLSKFIPNANGPLRSSEVCMFTNTPDFDFLIDFHPKHRQVLIVSPCSGHGFKFSSAIGEICADLLTEGESQYDIARFSLDRFGA